MNISAWIRRCASAVKATLDCHFLQTALYQWVKHHQVKLRQFFHLQINSFLLNFQKIYWSANINTIIRGGRMSSNFQPLGKNWRSVVPRTLHQNFSFQFESKPWLKGDTASHCSLSALVLIRADLLRIESQNFGGEFLGPQIINFSLRVWNFLTFIRPNYY
jgi:hypothetical protein